MPELSDLQTSGDDARGYTVYRSVRINRLQSKRGAILGHITKLADGTYEPTGTGAMFGHPEPCLTLRDALQAFVGWD